MADVILHNYPISPIAEKARLAIGLKGLSWRSVEIPRFPPKPLLLELTGGYRRTPVMQIGADIYCDSQCIARELERRFPEPTFFPVGGAGLGWALCRWADDHLFKLAAQLVLGGGFSSLPEELAKDRGRLVFGQNWATELAAMEKNIGHIASQMRAQLTWIEQQLADGNTFLSGSKPSYYDVGVYSDIWFFQDRWSGGRDLLKEFPNITAWMDRVGAIGHGTPEPLSAEDAIQIAADATPTHPQGEDPNDTQGLRVGDKVEIHIDTDGGEVPIAGHLHSLSPTNVVISRESEKAGLLCVHFPRTGIRVEKL